MCRVWERSTMSDINGRPLKSSLRDERIGFADTKVLIPTYVKLTSSELNFLSLSEERGT